MKGPPVEVFWWRWLRVRLTVWVKYFREQGGAPCRLVGPRRGLIVCRANAPGVGGGVVPPPVKDVGCSHPSAV